MSTDNLLPTGFVNSISYDRNLRGYPLYYDNGSGRRTFGYGGSRTRLVKGDLIGSLLYNPGNLGEDVKPQMAFGLNKVAHRSDAINMLILEGNGEAASFNAKLLRALGTQHFTLGFSYTVNTGVNTPVGIRLYSVHVLEPKCRVLICVDLNSDYWEYELERADGTSKEGVFAAQLGRTTLKQFEETKEIEDEPERFMDLG